MSGDAESLGINGRGGLPIVESELVARLEEDRELPAFRSQPEPILAAEHVQLAVEKPQPLMDAIRHAGSVFLGRMTPEAVGDYVAGPNHVLPTGRRARFSSGLSVLDFMKRTSFIQLDEAALRAVGPAAIELAEADGAPTAAADFAHAQTRFFRFVDGDDSRIVSEEWDPASAAYVVWDE